MESAKTQSGSVSPTTEQPVRRAQLGIFARITRNLIAAFAFGIYAVAVISLHQERNVPFVIEAEGPIQAALSHRLYGTRLGYIDGALLPYFDSAAPGESAEHLVARAVADHPPPTGNTSVVAGGVGVGPIILTGLAFFVFGPSAQALPLFQLLLIGISTLCFIMRYQDRRMVAAPMLLAAFTGLLLTSVSVPPWDAQAPLGGVRYYAIVGILPALHWCLDVLGPVPPSRRETCLKWACLVIQTAILAVAILVRGSPVYLLIPATICAYLAWRGMPGAKAKRAIVGDFLIPVAVLIEISGISPRLIFPGYAKSGLLHTVIWHRAFVSYGVNPDFPFPGLRAKYNCMEWIPEGLVHSTVDRNGHCVWLAQPGVLSRYQSAENPTLGVYGSEYEAVLRRAFFGVMLSNPWDALITFAYYKPATIFRQIVSAFEPPWPPVSWQLFRYVVYQGLIFIFFVCASPTRRALRDARVQALALFGFAVPALVPQLIAWANPVTVIDLMVFVLCAGLIALALTATYGAFGLRTVSNRFHLRGGRSQSR